METPADSANPIESTFATVRHRTIRSKGCLTLIHSAKLNGVEPEAHLREVLTCIGEHPIDANDALLPLNVFTAAMRTAT